MRYCSNCGSLNDTDAKFCAKCGKQLGVDIVPEPEAKIEEVVAEAADEAPEVLETPAETAETAAESIEESAEEVADAVAEASEETVEAAEEVIDTPAAEETPCCAAEVQPEIQPEVQPEEQPEIQPVPVAEPVCEVTAAPDEPKLAKGQKYDRPVKGRAFGVIGFILGLDSLIWCWVPVYNLGSFICSIIALIFTGISRKNTSFKLARVGRVFSIIALIASIVSIILFTGLFIFGLIALFENGNLEEIFEKIAHATVDIDIHTW